MNQTPSLASPAPAGNGARSAARASTLASREISGWPRAEAVGLPLPAPVPSKGWPTARPRGCAADGQSAHLAFAHESFDHGPVNAGAGQVPSSRSVWPNTSARVKPVPSRKPGWLPGNALPPGYRGSSSPSCCGRHGPGRSAGSPGPASSRRCGGGRRRPSLGGSPGIVHRASQGWLGDPLPDSPHRRLVARGRTGRPCHPERWITSPRDSILK